jgi:hypothetical protein
MEKMKTLRKRDRYPPGRAIILLFILVFTCYSCNGSFPLRQQTMTPVPTIPVNLTDRSWWQDQPCRTPCWYGLKLGETTPADARQVIDQLPFLDPASEHASNGGYWDYAKKINFGADLVTYEYKQPNNMICIVLTFVENKLVRIDLGPNYPITFKELVEKIGPPDKVGARSVAPEIIDCDIVLTWVDRQISAFYYERKEDSGRNLCRIVRDAGMKPFADLQIHDVIIELPEQLQGEMKGNGDQPWSGFNNQGK